MSTKNEERMHDLRRRQNAIRFATFLIDKLTDEQVEWTHLRGNLIMLGDALGLDAQLIMMACHPLRSHKEKLALSLLNAAFTGQPKEVLQRLHAELGEVLS